MPDETRINVMQAPGAEGSRSLHGFWEGEKDPEAKPGAGRMSVPEPGGEDGAQAGKSTQNARNRPEKKQRKNIFRIEKPERRMIR